MDRLEPRRLLASAVVDGTLVVEGTGGNDVIHITLDSPNVTVRVNEGAQEFALGEVDRVEVRGGDGNDQVVVDVNLERDALLLGEGGDDSLVGGGGDDVLVGGAGNDGLDGGGDWDAPAGHNVADFSDLSADLTLQDNLVLGGGQSDSIFRNIQKVILGSGNDTVNQTSSGDGSINEVDGGPGNDTIELLGFDGDITARGGAGNDRLLVLSPGFTGWYFGDEGNDIFTVWRSSATNREFHGGPGSDTADYRGFINEFWPVQVSLDGVANDGSPTEWESQTDRDNAHSDIERIIGTPGPDSLVGGAGNEILYGMAGNDTIRGGPGNDRLYGGDGNDWLSGDAGNDVIYGEAGNDRMFGGDGRDAIFTGPGNDLVRGGLGIDRLMLFSRRGDLRGNVGDLIRMVAG